MNTFIGFAVQGFFMGFGVATANWFHERHIVKRIEQIEKRLRK